MAEVYSFGEWVRRRRKALDLTQDGLASRVGCSKVLISKIETDARRPSREVAALLATALELEVGDRPAFVQAARTELAPDRLPSPATRMPPLALTMAAAAPMPAPQTPPLAEPLPDLTTQDTLSHQPPGVPSEAAATRRAVATSTNDWLWLWWIAASAAGWGLGRLLGWTAGSLIYLERVIDLGDGAQVFGAGVALAIETLIPGLCVAVAQAPVLRRHLSATIPWAIATSLAWLLAGVSGRLLPGLAGGLLIGLSLGVAQWLVLRRSPRARWWILVSTVAWAPVWVASGTLNAAIYQAIGGTMSEVAYERGAGWAISLLLAGALLGGAQGILTGGILAWVLGSPRSPASSTDAH